MMEKIWTGTYISPLNIFSAFKARPCLHLATSNPVSSKFVIVLETAFAAFQRVVPHTPLAKLT